MMPRPALTSLALILCTMIAGLVLRFAPLGLPPYISKYGGSMLWAVMIYWIVSSLLPRFSLVPLALLSGLLAAAIELLKLYHTPGLDAFRLTLPGILLLGRFFSLWDIVAYWIAIAFASVLDRTLRASPAIRPAYDR